MNFKPLLAGVIVLSTGNCACGSARRGESPDSSELVVSEVKGLLPAPAEGGEPSGPAAPACVPEDCPELSLFGSSAPGCCRGNAGCGGRVTLASNSWACLPPGYDETVHALRAAVARHADEPSMPDPACPSATLDGTTLSGCCDVTGRCGVSTDPWTLAASRFGVPVQSICLPRSEAAQLSHAPEPDAGPPLACGPAAAG